MGISSVKVKKRDVSLGSFFEFAIGQPAFGLKDIINETEEKGVVAAALKSQGNYVYNSEFVVNQRMAELQGVAGVRFLFFLDDPDTNNLFENDAIETATIIFPSHDLVNKKITKLPKRGGFVSLTGFAGGEKRVLMSTQGGRKALPDEMSVPNTENAPPQPGFETVSNTAWINNRDPAELASKGNYATIGLATAMSLSAYSDAGLQGEYGLPPRVATASPQSGISIKNLRYDLRNKRQGSQDNLITRQDDTNSIGNTKSGATAISLVPTKRLMSQDFFLSKAQVYGYQKIYVQIAALIKNNRNVKGAESEFSLSTKRKKVTIEHQESLANWLLNPEPPNVSVVYVNYRRVKIRILKDDPTLVACHILRIRKNPALKKDEIKDMGTHSFNSEGVINFDDVISNVKPNQFIYRVAVVNFDESLGEFTSVVLPSFKKVSDPLSSTAIPISILASNSGGAIKITVKSLNDKTLSLRLLRQEIGKFGEFSDTVVEVPPQKGQQPLVIVGNGKRTVHFMDLNAIHGRKYRYFCAYRAGTRLQIPAMSQEIMSDEDEIIVCRKPAAQKLPVLLSIDQPQTVQGQNGISVNFKINAAEVDNLFNTVKKALQDAGISDQFVAELQKDDIKARQFVLFLIERFDVTTGRKETFGIHPTTDFSDNAETQKLAGVSPLEPGKKYSYIFKVCLQDPATFLQTTNVGLINKFGKEIQKKAARFSRFIYDRMGVLPSESDIKNGVSMEQIISESQLGFEFVLNAQIPKSIGKVGAFDIIEDVNFNMLKWSMTGDTADISYFLVYCTFEGEKNLLGSVSAAKSINSYTFKDTRYHRDVGTKSYFVTPVTYSDEKLGPSPTASQQKTFSIPENMIVGAIFGSFGKKSKIIPVAPARGQHKKIMPPKEHDGGDGTGDALSALSQHLENHLSKPTPQINPTVFDYANIDHSLVSGLQNIGSALFGPGNEATKVNLPNFGGDVLSSPYTNVSVTAGSAFNNIGNNVNVSAAANAFTDSVQPTAQAANAPAAQNAGLQMDVNENYTDYEADNSAANNSNPGLGSAFGFKSIF